jgi:hypothetical protein
VLAVAGVLEATAGAGALAVGEATEAAEVQVGGGAEVVCTAGDIWKVQHWFWWFSRYYPICSFPS